MRSPHDLVLEFHKTYGQPTGPVRPSSIMDLGRLTMRLGLILEEFQELCKAADVHDIGGEVDALGDLVYVIYGMAIEMGVNLDPILEEIHRSNMSKLDSDDKPIYRDDGKVLKGPKYFEPDIYGVLREQGY